MLRKVRYRDKELGIRDKGTAFISILKHYSVILKSIFFKEFQFFRKIRLFRIHGLAFSYYEFFSRWIQDRLFFYYLPSTYAKASVDRTVGSEKYTFRDDVKNKATKKEKGFSLIEAMVSTAIMGIGFVGVLTLVSTSEQFTARAIAKQKIQMMADQMLDIIETDRNNIDSYAMSLETCVDPGASTNQYDIRGYEWCMRLADELGAAGTTNNRFITVSTVGDRKLVYILLEANNGRVQVVMARLFDA